jgi:hypothetical protein
MKTEQEHDVVPLQQDAELPKYEVPKIAAMSEEEVLKAFQMTAAQISAAGCWWSSTSWVR